MSPRLLFIGAGAVGSSPGGFLTRAGHDVTLVAPWPEQVDAIRGRGVPVTGPHEPASGRLRARRRAEADVWG